MWEGACPRLQWVSQILGNWHTAIGSKLIWPNEIGHINRAL